MILSCAGAVLDEYNTPTPKVWQELGLLPTGPTPTEFQSWAPASRMNVHVAGSDIWSAATVSNGSGLPPLYNNLEVRAFGRRCLGSREAQPAGSADSATDAETVLARFSDGSTAVSIRDLGRGSVVRFSWLPGVSHLSASAKPKGAPGSPAPSALTAAAQWLNEMVKLARNPAPPVVTADVPLVETPILLSHLGAVVTVLDWRPSASRSKELVLNVTIPFQPHAIHSAQSGALTWQPQSYVAGNGHTGSVLLTTPRDGADYVSFHRKPTALT